MSFRLSALVAGLAVLGAAEFAPVWAQPQAPIRPRYSTFGNIFSPNRGAAGGVVGNAQMQPFVNPIGPQVAGVAGPGVFIPPGSGALPLALPGALGAPDALARPTGVVGSFNNLGHWYAGGTGAGGGLYGHWYPNGIANGRGITGYGGGGGGFAGGGTGLSGGAVGPRTGGSLMGTALTGAATVGQLRR